VTDYFDQYRLRQRKIRFLRFVNICDEEDSILEEMDKLWWKLSEEERALIDSEKHCDISDSIPKHGLVDIDIYSHIGSVVRNTGSA
jgi:hypothetical protein